jgi:AcrR family transcriptional regulator
MRISNSYAMRQVVGGSKSGARRARLVDAGLKLFLKRSYDSTTLKAIAEAADVSRRSLFHFFPTK